MSKAGKAIEVAIEVVTPKTARAWLEANHVNRNVRPKVVNAYRRDMEAGRWVFTGEPIQISQTGALLNGQHRLAALADAKGVRGIDFVVARGLPDSTQTMMDQGVARNVRDALHLEHGHIKNINVVGSLCRWLVLAPDVGSHVTPQTLRNKVTTAEALDVFGSDSERIVEAAWQANPIRVVMMGSPTAIAYAWYQLAKVDSSAVTEFFAGMLDMEWSMPNDPRKAALRRMQILHRDQETKASIETGVMLVSILTRAWNHWRKGEPIESLHVRTKTGIILPVTPI